MKLQISIFFVGLVLSVAGATVRAEDKYKDQVLTTIDLATGESGEFHTLDAGKTNVLVFLSSQCKCSKSHVEHIKKLAAEFSEVHFVGIVSNSDEDWKTSGEYFKSIHATFPIVADKNKDVLNRYAAYKTPHTFVVDRAGDLVYAGGVTDSMEFSDGAKFYLKAALTTLKNGKKPDPAFVRALGCEIKR